MGSMATSELVPSEEAMEEIFIKNWASIQRDGGILAQQVRRHQKRIDIVYIPKYSNRFGNAYSIELKIKDWKGCLRQCLRNRVLLPYNYMAIWDKFAHRVDHSCLKSEGIGLIIVSLEKNEIVFKPKKSKFVEKSIYSKLRNDVIQVNLKYGE